MKIVLNFCFKVQKYQFKDKFPQVLLLTGFPIVGGMGMEGGGWGGRVCTPIL